jgi:hypothetical protein
MPVRARRTIWLTILASLAMALVESDIATAEDPAPTLAKCTCQFDEKAPPANQGARASNATLCVQILDPSHKWCEITVHCLRGKIGPNCGAAPAPKEAVLKLYGESVQQMKEAGGRQLEFLGSKFDSNGTAIAQLLDANKSLLDNCARAYVSRSETFVRTEGQFACKYDREDRWLALAFRLYGPSGPAPGDQFIQFSFGPPE